MPTRLIRLAEIKEITGLSSSSIYLMMHDGRFPKSVKIGKRAVAWKEDEVDAWQAGLNVPEQLRAKWI